MGDIISSFKFFEKIDTPQESLIMRNVEGDTLKLQVYCDGAFSMQLLGKIDTEIEEFTVLTVFDDNGFNMANSITKNGSYTISISGYSQIKAVLASVTGEIRAFGKAVGE